MCVVSMVSDDFTQREWHRIEPIVYPNPLKPVPRDEFEKLRRDVNELKELLKAAKRYDENTGQPDCEQEEKTRLLKDLAEALDIDLSEVI